MKVTFRVWFKLGLKKELSILGDPMSNIKLFQISESFISLVKNLSSFFSNIGVHLEIGYTFWNYTNSLFEKNNIQTDYNFF